MRVRTSMGILSVILLNAVSLVSFAAPFPDTIGNPDEPSIKALAALGVIAGYEDGTFRPDAMVNRAELLKMLVIGTGTQPVPKDSGCFPDVSDEWFSPYVCYAKKQGWVTGYDDGTFKPGQPVTTAEALKMMMVAFGYVPAQSSSAPSHAGIDPAAWYAPYVFLASDQNVVQFSDTFDAAAQMSRAGIGGMLYRCIVKAQQAGTLRIAKPKPAASSSASSELRRRSGGGGGGASQEEESSSDSSEGGGVSLTEPSIVFGDISKDFDDADFALAPTSDSDGAFTYESSDTAVATVSSGVVTIVGVGSTVLTATQAAHGGFTGGSKTATLTVSAVAPTITFNNISKNYGDATFALSPSSNSAGTFSYVSGNTAVATVAGNVVTIVGAGTATITATQAANGNYTSDAKSATLTVSPIAPTLGGFSNILKQMGDIPFALTAPTSNSAGTFSYASDNTGVATVAGNVVTLVSNGAATITATQAANGNYTSGTRTLTLTVFMGQCITAPCQNGGTCSNGPGGTYSCECTEGFSGAECELSDAGCNYDYGFAPCLNGGTCIPDIMGGYCSCTPDFCGTQCSLLDTDGEADGYCAF